MLAPTQPKRMLDTQGRPYFLWDTDLTCEQFSNLIEDVRPEIRAFYVAKLMRQAKPDDVFTFVSERTIRELWSQIQPHLGQQRAFWSWLLELWDGQQRGR